MKNVLLISTLTLILSACSTSRPTSESLEQKEMKAYEYYQTNPKKALSMLKEVSKGYAQLNNLKKVSVTNLNIANIYDEALNDYAPALKYATQSLNAATQFKDTLQMANLLKYSGYLEGRLKKFNDAEQHIKTAISYYESQKYPSGVAVSRFDMAKVLYEKGDYGKALYFLNLAQEFWRYKADNERIFVQNMLGIKLHAQLNQNARAQELFQECERLKGGIELNAFVLKEYETLVKDLRLK